MVIPSLHPIYKRYSNGTNYLCQKVNTFNNIPNAKLGLPAHIVAGMSLCLICVINYISIYYMYTFICKRMVLVYEFNL